MHLHFDLRFKRSERLCFCGNECEGLRPERGANGAGFLVPTNDFSLLTRTALPIPDATGDVRRWVPRHSDRFRMYIPPKCEASNLLELVVFPPMRWMCLPACSEVVVGHNSRLGQPVCASHVVELLFCQAFVEAEGSVSGVDRASVLRAAGRAERRGCPVGGKNDNVAVIGRRRRGIGQE